MWRGRCPAFFWVGSKSPSQPPPPWPTRRTQCGVAGAIALVSFGPYIWRHVVAYLFGAFTPDPAGWFHPPVSASPRAQTAHWLGWLHEVKHDGYRIIARKEGGRVTLWSRYGTNFTDRLPKIAEAVCSLAAESEI